MGSVELVVVLPWPFASLPHAGVHGVGIGRIDLHVGGPCVLVPGDYFLPALTPVGGTVETAFSTRPVRMSEHRGENTVRVARVDGEPGNLLGIVEAKMHPGLAGIGGLVNSVAY